MTFLSCICGSSRDEKHDKPEQEYVRSESSKSKLNEDINEKQRHSMKDISQPSQVKSDSTPHDKDTPGSTVPGLGQDEVTEQGRSASTRPTDSPHELSREPEEEFGKKFLITDESIDKQTSGSYQTTRTNTNDPEATEEDRWFETQETYPTHH